jgi:hypothetical protein
MRHVDGAPATLVLDTPRSLPISRRLIRDLEALGNVELAVGGKRYVLRTGARPAAARAFATCRVALPSTLKQV